MTSNTHADSDFCGCIPNLSGLDTERSNPDLTVKAEKSVNDHAEDVRVYFRDNDWFHDRGYSFAYGLGEVGGDEVWINTMYGTDDPHVLMHELAHTLGFEHEDGGIVGYGYDNCNDMGRNDALARPTELTAKSFDLYRYCTWGINDLGALSTEFARNNIDISTLGYASSQYARNGAIDVYLRQSKSFYGHPTQGGLDQL